VLENEAEEIERTKAECLRIYAGEHVQPMRAHVMFLMRQMLGIAEGLLCRRCINPIGVKRELQLKPGAECSARLVTVKSVRQERKRGLDMSSHPAIGAVLKVITSAIHDPKNPLGSPNHPSYISEYGNLFAGLLMACNSVGDLPCELRTLSQEEAGPIVNEVVARLKVSSVHAQHIVDVATLALRAFLQATVGGIESLALAIKDENAAKALAVARPQK
jgi:hypothetical protein